jgi:hypothetical protein
MMRPILAGSSFLSQEPAEAHFGLGTATTATVRIEWPDGLETVFTDVAADQILTVTPADGFDSDSDGLLDSIELGLGTDPMNPDSDGDGVPDGVEVGNPASPTDTDGDLTIDALDTDDDDDGLLTIDEDANGNGNPPEMRAHPELCRFRDCSHIAEPGCAVRDALRAGTVSVVRYDSYVKLRSELGDEGPHFPK